MRRGFSSLAVVLLSLTLGWHWLALQSIAWASMLIERSGESSFSVAWTTTFDGKHPCRICKAVAEGQSNETRTTSTVSVHMLEAAAPATLAVVISAPRVEPFTLRRDPAPRSRGDRPILPPPRQA
ncbi:MAG: hypothetical protein ACKO3H_07485 [Verrucomicrobiota bacterium]